LLFLFVILPHFHPTRGGMLAGFAAAYYSGSVLPPIWDFLTPSMHISEYIKVFFIVSMYTCECLCEMELISWSDRSYVFPGRLQFFMLHSFFRVHAHETLFVD
jgi:hypothetical protein